jgi:hypothetical protein
MTRFLVQSNQPSASSSRYFGAALPISGLSCNTHGSRADPFSLVESSDAPRRQSKTAGQVPVSYPAIVSLGGNPTGDNPRGDHPAESGRASVANRQRSAAPELARQSPLCATDARNSDQSRSVFNGLRWSSGRGVLVHHPCVGAQERGFSSGTRKSTIRKFFKERHLRIGGGGNRI